MSVYCLRVVYFRLKGDLVLIVRLDSYPEKRFGEKMWSVDMTFQVQLEEDGRCSIRQSLMEISGEKLMFHCK